MIFAARSLPQIGLGPRWVSGLLLLLLVAPWASAQSSSGVVRHIGGLQRGQTAQDTNEEQAPAQEQEPAVSPDGIFGELSRELSKLRRNSRFGVRISGGADGGSMVGVHLGEGLVAAPWCPDRQTGERATVYAHQRAFRAVKVGEIPNFLGLYRMRDFAHVEPLPAPEQFFADADQGRLGDLVLVLDTQRARISFLHEQRYRRDAGGVDGKDREQDVRKKPAEMQVFAYGLADTESRAGSLVVAANGSLVGVLVRPEWRRPVPEKDREGDAGAGGDEKRDEKHAVGRERGGFAMVLDAKMLWELGRKRAALFDLRNVEPSIGVRLNAVKKARGEAETPQVEKPSVETPATEQAAGFVVTRIYAGSPAERAGVQRLDRWLELGGEVLVDLAQIQKALKALEPGGKLIVHYERQGKRGKLEIWPD